MRWWFLTLPEAALPDPDGAGNTVVNHYAPDIDHLSALLISALLILLADAERAATGHRVEFALCQFDRFAKYLFHYSRYCLQLLALTARTHFLSRLFSCVGRHFQRITTTGPIAKSYERHSTAYNEWTAIDKNYENHFTAYDELRGVFCTPD